uniref:Uncharacterized protein LOC114346404 isoform X2 n=1 Tax=Diabrotica virgifera virgifera TaxID=50390 RepID=A0A6P7H359_DIAVI
MNRGKRILNECLKQGSGDIFANIDSKPAPVLYDIQKKLEHSSNDGYLEVEVNSNGYLEVDVNFFENQKGNLQIQEQCTNSASNFQSNQKVSNWLCNRGFVTKNNENCPARQEFIDDCENQNILQISTDVETSAFTKETENTENDYFLRKEDSNDDEDTTIKKYKTRNYQKLNFPISTGVDDNPQVNASTSIEVTKTKTPYKRKPDHCYFCETEVLNFSRHIIRIHPTEIEVAEIMAKPIKSKERKQLFNALRRKGNFLAKGGSCFKPVREGYVPGRKKRVCNNCLGHFSSKLLYRHKKKCAKTNSGSKSITIFSNIKVDRRLKEEVFPRMRADKISLEAQTDPLICEFGTRYLKTHREKHFVNVTSRKMRELAKILLEMRVLETSITTLLSALKPTFFDLFVQATKRIAKYDKNQDIYLSPTFAMNIVTSLKQCCDIAITFIYTKNMPNYSLSVATVEADLKTLIRLFDSNWSFEISSHAANNLNINKWNKITIVPLASDLRLLREHLIKLATKSLQVLTKQMNDVSGSTEADETDCKVLVKDSVEIQAYNNLMETIYCRVILFNRKRSGELQRMYLHTYLNATPDIEKYQEFNSVVSLPEKILLKSLKRVVIRGKRGKGVPVLFHSDIQEHINIILKIRNCFVPKNNPYLFATANSNTHLIGYKVLSKQSKLCGAQNPSSITSTRLRKHLATLSQLFNLSEGEIEQLATFMGHTPGVHRSSYRLPDDVYQTAKISKLLMVMEKGGADQYKGKSIDDIDINMEENLLEFNYHDSDEGENDMLDDLVNSKGTEMSTSNSNADNTLIKTTAPKLKKKIIRKVVPWTKEQKEVTLKYFKNHIKVKKAPKRLECVEFKEKFKKVMDNKDWLKIKVFIQNAYKDK